MYSFAVVSARECRRCDWTSFTDPNFCALVAIVRRSTWKFSVGSSNASRRGLRTLYRKLAGSRNPPSAFGNIGSSGEDFLWASLLHWLLPQEGSLHSNFHCLSSAASPSGMGGRRRGASLCL